jgi:peptidoglycan/LPS O-acetylase OafA/YrhL
VARARVLSRRFRKKEAGIRMIQRKYTNLDAIRGLAAILIVLRHAPVMFISPQFQQSYLAVDIFFGMSGFVVANAYEARLRSGSLTFFSFTKIRLIRLLPFYLLGTLIGLFEHFFEEPGGAHAGIRSVISAASLVLLPLLMLPARAKPLYPVDNPAWSLLYEVVANCAYAKLVRMNNTRVLAMASVVSGVVIFLYSIVHDSLDAGWNISDGYIALARVVLSFSVGVLLYRRRAAYVQHRKSAALSALTLIGAALMLCIDVPAGWSGVATAAEVLLGVPALVYIATAAEPPSCVAPIFARLGQISYGLYITHVPVLMFLSKLPVNRERMYGAGGLLVFLCATLVVVAILDKYVDVPVRRALSKRFVRSEPAKKIQVPVTTGT